MAGDTLTLAESLYCLPRSCDTDAPLLPAGTPIRDLWRGDDYGELGFSWTFLASLDGGETWEAFETMWGDEEPFPFSLTTAVQGSAQGRRRIAPV